VWQGYRRLGAAVIVSAVRDLEKPTRAGGGSWRTGAEQADRRPDASHLRSIRDDGARFNVGATCRDFNDAACSPVPLTARVMDRLWDIADLVALLN